MEEKADRPGEILARQLRYWRQERRKLSAQGLADRLTGLGAPTLNRRVISKIETGERGVTLDEWLQLAHALAVPPPLLFLDLASGQPVRIADGAVIHPWLAWRWVTGEEPPIVTSRAVSRAAEFAEAKHAVYLYRFEGKASDAVHGAEREVSAAEFAGDGGALTAARTRYAEALKELARCLDDMVINGIQPPAMPRDWVENMRALKLLEHPERVEIFESEGDGGGS